MWILIAIAYLIMTAIGYFVVTPFHAKLATSIRYQLVADIYQTAAKKTGNRDAGVQAFLAIDVQSMMRLKLAIPTLYL